MKKYICYHWSRNDDCLGHQDGRKIVLGETLSVDGIPSLCNHGLHGSLSVIDSLRYASGSHLWKVEIWGSVDMNDDILCGKNRKAIVEYGNLLPIILEFAYWCANRAKQYTNSTEYVKSAKYAFIAVDKYSKYAEYVADSIAKYAAKSAEYATNSSKSERLLQEQWWQDKLYLLKGE